MMNSHEQLEDIGKLCLFYRIPDHSSDIDFLAAHFALFWPIVRAVRTELLRPVANFEDCCIEPESAMNLRFSPVLHFAVLA